MDPAVGMDSVFTAAAWGASISMTCHSLATITPDLTPDLYKLSQSLP